VEQKEIQNHEKALNPFENNTRIATQTVVSDCLGFPDF
jgi:hypothetical protein